MRPLKLMITAFGPYATEQVINFAELQGRNLFVITGDTGAGKTTILDAIAYALYGRASGRDRDGETLRSHFATADLLTVIELEFELRGKRYWVQRIPKQRKKRARGEGYTDQNAEAQWKCMDEASGVISGVKEVNEKIVQLLGLSYDQFKQIIMIPQGEFRELLNADSKVRQDILQKIFGTEGFRRVQELFDQQAKALSQEVSILESQRDECIHSLDGSGYSTLAAVVEQPSFNLAVLMEAVKQAISLDEGAASGLQDQVAGTEKLVAEKQGEIFQGKANNQKLDAKDTAHKQKTTLEAREPEMAEKRTTLQQGRKALELIGAEEYRDNRAAGVRKKREDLLKADQRAKTTESALGVAKENYQVELAKESQRNELLTEQARLQGLTAKVADWDARQTTNAGLENELLTVKKDRDATKAQLEKTRGEIKVGQTNLDKARTAKTEYILKALELEKANDICTKLAIMKEENDALITLQQSILRLQQQEGQQLVEWEKDQANYDEAQRLFLEGQAGLLAAKLKAGDACPVCGSVHHLQLAVLTDEIPSEIELKKLIAICKQSRELYDGVKSKYERIKSDNYAQHQIVSRLQAEVDALVVDNLAVLKEEALASCIAKILAEWQLGRQRLTEDLKKLFTQKKDENGLAIALTEKNAAVDKLETGLANLETQYTEVFARVQSANSAMASLEAEIPHEVRSTAALTKALRSMQVKFEVMKQALEKADQQWRDSQVNHTTAVAEKNGAAQSLQEAESELMVAQQKFTAALLVAGFSGETEYANAKLAERTINSLEKEITNYQEELRSVRDRYLQVQREVAGLSATNITALEAEHVQLQQKKDQLITQRTAIIARQVHNQIMLTKLCSLVNKLEQKEEEYQLIGHLAKIARGDNEQKVSFERYVLAAFFNDIINAANIRLNKMTGGRYQMNRILQKAKGGGQSGLEIEVFDYYTGQARHVKTLSGGESFKASLALALGLAEVVQSYAGGISLETMFVDEGFGTLDPESLETAIDCLIELQHSGRLVGIISHVPELKDSVDARLEIEAFKDGSRAQFCIL